MTESRRRKRKTVPGMGKDARPVSLGALRKALQITQVEVAARLGWSQGEVSRLERRADMYVSSLTSYIAALDGCLELRARIEKRAYTLRLGVQEERKKP